MTWGFNLLRLCLFSAFIDKCCAFFSRDFNFANFCLIAKIVKIKVARYSFSGPIPPKFEHKLRRHKQSFGKIATTVVLDKDENLL